MIIYLITLLLSLSTSELFCMIEQLQESSFDTNSSLHTNYNTKNLEQHKIIFTIDLDGILCLQGKPIVNATVYSELIKENRGYDFDPASTYFTIHTIPSATFRLTKNPAIIECSTEENRWYIYINSAEEYTCCLAENMTPYAGQNK